MPANPGRVDRTALTILRSYDGVRYIVGVRYIAVLESKMVELNATPSYVELLGQGGEPLSIAEPAEQTPVYGPTGVHAPIPRPVVPVAMGARLNHAPPPSHRPWRAAGGPRLER